MQAIRFLKWWRAGYAIFMENVYGEEWVNLAYADSLESYRECEAWWDERRERGEWQGDPGDDLDEE